MSPQFLGVLGASWRESSTERVSGKPQDESRNLTVCWKQPCPGSGQTASPAGPGVKPRPTRHRGRARAGSLCSEERSPGISNRAVPSTQSEAEKTERLQHVGHAHAFPIDSILSSK